MNATIQTIAQAQFKAKSQPDPSNSLKAIPMITLIVHMPASNPYSFKVLSFGFFTVDHPVL
jgi:hypothetical protein